MKDEYVNREREQLGTIEGRADEREEKMKKSNGGKEAPHEKREKVISS